MLWEGVTCGLLTCSVWRGLQHWSVGCIVSLWLACDCEGGGARTHLLPLVRASVPGLHFMPRTAGQCLVSWVDLQKPIAGRRMCACMPSEACSLLCSLQLIPCGAGTKFFVHVRVLLSQLVLGARAQEPSLAGLHAALQPGTRTLTANVPLQVGLACCNSAVR